MRADDIRTVTADAAVTEVILVVEDDDGLRALVEQVLRMAGYQVLTAGNCDEAILACAGHPGPIHLLLSDLTLPGASGTEVAARVTESSPDIKVLFMSGYAAADALKDAVANGKAHFIAKPFSIEALRRKVREVLRG